MEKPDHAARHDVGRSKLQGALTPTVVEDIVKPFVLSDDDDDDYDGRRGTKTPTFFHKPELDADDSTLPGAIDDEFDDEQTFEPVAAAAETRSKTKTDATDRMNRREQLSVVRIITTGHPHSKNFH